MGKEIHCRATNVRPSRKRLERSKCIPTPTRFVIPLKGENGFDSFSGISVTIVLLSSLELAAVSVQQRWGKVFFAVEARIMRTSFRNADKPLSLLFISSLSLSSSRPPNGVADEPQARRQARLPERWPVPSATQANFYPSPAIRCASMTSNLSSRSACKSSSACSEAGEITPNSLSTS
jgi:hypothetical protein